MTFGKARQRARKRGKRGFFLRDCAATNGLLNVRGFWSIKRKEGDEEEEEEKRGFCGHRRLMYYVR